MAVYVEIPAVRGSHPGAADRVVVARSQGRAGIQGLNDLVQHGRFP
jgi:hypothetical protein